MKFVLDIMGATEKSGGMRLHATEIVHAWMTRFPSDQIYIVGSKWAKDEFKDFGSIHVIPWPNERVITRSMGQLLVSPLVRLMTKSHAVVSLSPIVSKLVPNKRAFCFQHDWRHIKNPTEFSLIQRLYRVLWKVSAQHAHYNFCISKKSQIETIEIVPGSRTIVVENGGDHASRWAPEPDNGRFRNCIVTFGHHNNKRPELVIRAMAEGDLKSENETLIVLGARGAYADKLSDLAESLGIRERIEFPGFISEQDYQDTIRNAKLIVLASSDEGFGLPIVEAKYFGIPAVVTSDSGMQEIFDDLYVCDPDPHSVSQLMHKAILDLRVGTSRNSSYSQRWEDSVVSIREIVAGR